MQGSDRPLHRLRRSAGAGGGVVDGNSMQCCFIVPYKGHTCKSWQRRIGADPLHISVQRPQESPWPRQTNDCVPCSVRCCAFSGNCGKNSGCFPTHGKALKAGQYFVRSRTGGGYLSKTHIAICFPICSYGYRTQTASNRIIFFFPMQRVYTILNTVLIPHQELSGNYNCVQEYPAAYHTKTHPANGCHTCYCL